MLKKMVNVYGNNDNEYRVFTLFCLSLEIIGLDYLFERREVLELRIFGSVFHFLRCLCRYNISILSIPI